MNLHRVRIGILNCMNWWTNEVSLKWSAASVIRISRTTHPFLYVIEIGIIFSFLLYIHAVSCLCRSYFKQTSDCSVAKSNAKCDTWPLDCIWQLTRASDDLRIIHGSLFPPLAPRSYLTASTRRRQIAPPRHMSSLHTMQCPAPTWVNICLGIIQGPRCQLGHMEEYWRLKGNIYASCCLLLTPVVSLSGCWLGEILLNHSMLEVWTCNSQMLRNPSNENFVLVLEWIWDSFSIM